MILLTSTLLINVNLLRVHQLSYILSIKYANNTRNKLHVHTVMFYSSTTSVCLLFFSFFTLTVPVS